MISYPIKESRKFNILLVLIWTTQLNVLQSPNKNSIKNFTENNISVNIWNMTKILTHDYLGGLHSLMTLQVVKYVLSWSGYYRGTFTARHTLIEARPTFSLTSMSPGEASATVGWSSGSTIARVVHSWDSNIVPTGLDNSSVSISYVNSRHCLWHELIEYKIMSILMSYWPRRSNTIASVGFCS